MPRLYAVSEITRLIRSLLQNEFGDILVEGEISNYRPSSTGHLYFSLKDGDALLSVAMFKNRLRGLTFEPADGAVVQARGSISVYGKRGTYQLVCESLTLSGEGEILAMLEKRKRALAAEGLFDAAAKKALPVWPATVAVVTSPTGAAIRDVLRVTRRRNPSTDILILPTPVQGEDAAARIAAQVEVANRYALADVLIVTRGGGSLEDLLPFYDEAVVRAIHASAIPVVSAVGHETDTSLSDLAADLRAPTPSAAAEMVTPSRMEILRRVGVAATTLTATLNARLERARLLLAAFTPESTERSFRTHIQLATQRLDDHRNTIAEAMQALLVSLDHRVSLATTGLTAVSPLEVLRRGYSIVRRRDTGGTVTSADDVRVGDDIDIRLHHGSLAAEVSSKGDLP